MSCKIIFILLLLGLLAVKTTNAQDLGELNAKISAALESIAQNNPDSLSAVTERISELSQQIMSAQGNPSLMSELIAQLTSTLDNAADPNCGILKNGKQYYLRSADQKFATVKPGFQLAFMDPSSTSPSKFTIVQKECNLYAFYVDGYSMSRCAACPTPLEDYQSVRFHLTDSNSPWSQWTLSNVSGRPGVYNLKVDSNFGYLTYKSTEDGTDILSLDTQLNDRSQFELVEVVDNCGIILENGKQYIMQQADGRCAVLDKNKQLAFMRFASLEDSAKFTAVRKSCNVYGFCVDGACMSRCQNCTSDSKDFQTVKFHLSNSDLPWSQWTLTSPAGQYGGSYSLTAEPQYGNLIFKPSPTDSNDQLTLDVTDDVTYWQKRFEFVKVN